MTLISDLFLAAHLFGLLMLGATIFGLPLILRLNRCCNGPEGIIQAESMVRQIGRLGIVVLTGTGLLLMISADFAATVGFWFGIKLFAFATLVISLFKFNKAFQLVSLGAPGAEINANGFAIFNLATLAVAVTATAFAVR